MKIILNPLQKPATSKIKRNLDNTSLKKHFGKESPLNIWDKDIFSGE